MPWWWFVLIVMAGLGVGFLLGRTERVRIRQDTSADEGSPGP